MTIDLRDVQWAHVSPPFRALQHRFCIRTTDARLGHHLDDILADLTDSGAPPPADATYSLFESEAGDDRRHHVFWGDEPIVAAPRESLALGMLFHHVNGRAARSMADHLVLHAAAVAQGERGVILPAPMESGKSTLAAGLVQAGLAYLTDEAAAVDPSDLRLVAYPKPISLDRGSWPVLPDLDPGLDEFLSSYHRSQWQVPAHRIRPHAAAAGATASLLVLPHYQPGAVTSLEPVRPAAALVALCKCCFGFSAGDPASSRTTFAALASLVERLPCYRLVSSDLAESVDAVFGLLNQVGEEPHLAMALGSDEH